MKASFRLFTALAAASLALPMARADVVVSRFDTPAQAAKWHYDFGANGTATWDQTVDAGGSPNGGSGSLKIVIPAAVNLLSSTFTGDIYSPGANFSATNFTGIALDVKPGAGSLLDNGAIGFFKLIVRDGDAYKYVQQFGANLPQTNGWYHVEVPLTAPVEAARAFSVELFRDTAQNTSPTTFWIDNLVIRQPVPLPPPPITNNIAFKVSQFDTAAEVATWHSDFGPAPTLSWDSTVDAGSSPNAGSGAMKVVEPSDSGGAGSAITYDFALPPGTDLSQNSTYASIAIDVLVGPDDPVDYGNIVGNISLAIRNNNNYDWEPQINTNVLILGSFGWLHFQAPVSPTVNAARAFTIQMYRDTAQSAGTTTYWVDNVVLLGTGTPRPTITVTVFGSTATLSWNTVNGHSYQLLSSPTVNGSYTPVGSAIPGTGSTVQSPQSTSGTGKTFYHVQVQ